MTTVSSEVCFPAGHRIFAGVVALFVPRRRRPEAERPYRTWGYPWVPAAFLAGAVFLLGNYLVAEPLIFAADMVLIASGVPVYWIWVRGGTERNARA